MPARPSSARSRCHCRSRRILSCLKVVEKNKSNLMIGFNRRFDPNFAALEKRIRNGDIGTVELATIISRDPGAAAG